MHGIIFLTLMALISQTITFWGNWDKMSPKGKITLWATTTLLAIMLGFALNKTI